MKEILTTLEDFLDILEPNSYEFEDGIFTSYKKNNPNYHPFEVNYVITKEQLSRERKFIINKVIKNRLRKYEKNNIPFSNIVGYYKMIKNKSPYEYYFLDYLLFSRFSEYKENPMFYKHIVIQLAKNGYSNAIFLLGLLLNKENGITEDSLKLIIFASDHDCKYAETWLIYYPYVDENFKNSFHNLNLTDLYYLFNEPFFKNGEIQNFSKILNKTENKNKELEDEFNLILKITEYTYLENSYDKVTCLYRKFKYKLNKHLVLL